VLIRIVPTIYIYTIIQFYTQKQKTNKNHGDCRPVQITVYCNIFRFLSLLLFFTGIFSLRDQRSQQHTVLFLCFNNNNNNSTKCQRMFFSPRSSVVIGCLVEEMPKWRTVRRDRTNQKKMFHVITGSRI
jgi:hypothetical protein